MTTPIENLTALTVHSCQSKGVCMSAGGGGGCVRDQVSLRRRLLGRNAARVGCSFDSEDGGNQAQTPQTESAFLTRSAAAEIEGGRMSTSASALLPDARSSERDLLPPRPRSMVDSCGDSPHRCSPLNKSVDALRKQNCITKALSDPNCDKQPPAAAPFADIRDDRMSISMSEMSHTVNGKHRPSSLDSFDNCTCKSSERGIKVSTFTTRSGSTDSLARNSLLAAKVLRLIPTQKARERNYLHGRLASSSLLGAAELERVFPTREVEIFVGTWNMNGHMPPSELNDFLFPNSVKHVPDILAIGTQESVSETTEWEISIQEALGPSHLLFHSSNLGTLHLSIFLRRDLIWFCSLPEDSSISVRPGVAFRTKGAVAISFALFGTTFLFVTAHLTAHQEKVKERVHDIKRIIRSLDLPKNLPLKFKKNKDVTCNFDVVIWCGDLNFRLAEDRAAVMTRIANSFTSSRSSSSVERNPESSLLHADQLAAVLAAETILKGFNEAPIRFPPTYKYDPGTQRFDTSSKQRAPAYTDRILYKTKTNPTTSSIPGLRRSNSVQSTEPLSLVNCLAYDSVPSICSSDHKPVWALFTASLRPGTDIIPLAAGLFNRDVYLEGIKRRAALLDHPPGTSAVCSIQ